ncbi:unnamed protein product [Clonostachys rosea f. rosea IK726]|uniref:Uncharacterized protein n=1 Tax=Clonostachys rosea f. rosea IK726 TaxID=1349383 RepID=A0ACA9U1A2_BIOOC|nr:unnamed protein product [Clonostachys rosea f. rosea IK726]
MFQRGPLWHMLIQMPFTYSHGTRDVPIQISRRLVFRSAFDRYFPGLESSLQSGPHPFPLRKDTLSRAGVREETWTMVPALARAAGVPVRGPFQALEAEGVFEWTADTIKRAIN